MITIHLLKFSRFSKVTLRKFHFYCGYLLVSKYSTFMGDQKMLNEQGKPKALLILAEGAEEMEVVITVDVLRRGGIDVTIAGYSDPSHNNHNAGNENLVSPLLLTNEIRPITCSREVRIVPDKTLDDALKVRRSCSKSNSHENLQSDHINVQSATQSPSFNPYDIIIIPGGMQGAKTLAGSMKIGQILKRQEAEALGKPDIEELNDSAVSNKMYNQANTQVELMSTQESVPSKKYLAAICAGPLAFLSHGIGRGRRITTHPSIKDRFTSNPDMYTYVDDQDVVIDGPFITSRGPGTTFAFALAIVTELQSKKVADSIIQPMLLK